MSSRREREMAKHNMTMGFVVLAAIIIFIVFAVIKVRRSLETVNVNETESSFQESTISEEEIEALRVERVIEQARLLAKGYDYDGAIEYIENDEAYKKTFDLLIEVENLEKEKMNMVKWADVRLIPHIYVRNLIADEDKAFSSDKGQDYDDDCITVSEFENILLQLYENDYVLVGIHDIASMQNIKTESGSVRKIVWGSIELPEGKKPFILSEENVCYSKGQGKDGFATKLILLEDGTITCEMDDGENIQYGDFDVVPVLEKFITEHPDFSYRGARAILGVSGSEGVFGYQTSYKNKKDDGYEEEIKTAAAVADRLKELGYELGCNGYHYAGMSAASMDDETLMNEMENWKREVGTIIGNTDILIFPYGEDIGDWHYYSGERYETLKDLGYDYFINMNSSEKCWNQIREAYVRQGRRCISGKILRSDADGTLFSDLFDSSKVLDEGRAAAK